MKSELASARPKEQTADDVKTHVTNMINKQKVTGKFSKFVNVVVVSGLIDQIYKKERMYISNYDKDNILLVRGPIFGLDDCHVLKTNTGVEKPLQQPELQEPTLSEKIEALNFVSAIERQQKEKDLKAQHTQNTQSSANNQPGLEFTVQMMQGKDILLKNGSILSPICGTKTRGDSVLEDRLAEKTLEQDLQ